MNRLLNHLAASVLSTMLIVLTPFAQESETSPSPKPVDDTVTVAVEKETPPKKSSRRSRSSKTTYDDIVMFGGAPVSIKVDESARDVVVVGGDVEVDGSVHGSLVVVLGNVRLGLLEKLRKGR